MSEVVPGQPVEPSDRPDVGFGGPEVGFGGADGISSGLLARYLVGRVVAARVSISLLITALVVLAGAVAIWTWGPHWLAVLVGLVAVLVIAVRSLVMAILRRVMAVGRLGPAEDKVRALVGDTHGDLRRELRRIGLPATVFGMPLLIVRLAGKRRAETVNRLKHFDVDRVVPRSRRDELDFVLRSHLLHHS